MAVPGGAGSAMMIEAIGLRRVFRTRRREVAAVHGVDLAVAAGEVFAFLGPNGAGKSTTIRMLVTLLAPSAGRATVAGLDIARAPDRVRRHIGYVAQGGVTFRVDTGREELTAQARAFGASRRAARERAAELIARFGLAAVADRRTGTWSGGERRRLDIAIGLVHRPAVLFLDEPTLGLDPGSRAALWQEVRALRAEGTTVFLTTHYLDEADALADHLAIIDGGRIVAAGTPDELKRAVGADVLVIGAGADATRAADLLRGADFVRSTTVTGGTVRSHVTDGPRASLAALRLLDPAGIAVESLSLHRPSLDDVFLARTGRSMRSGGGAATPVPAPARPGGVAA